MKKKLLSHFRSFSSKTTFATTQCLNIWATFVVSNILKRAVPSSSDTTSSSLPNCVSFSFYDFFIWEFDISWNFLFVNVFNCQVRSFVCIPYLSTGRDTVTFAICIWMSFLLLSHNERMCKLCDYSHCFIANYYTVFSFCASTWLGYTL